MAIKLSDHFTYNKVLRFTLPTVIMLVFTSVYGVVDGFFVSNVVGKTPFAAVNFIMPFLMILGAIGFMFGTGGGALIARSLGEGKNEKANRQFSLFVYTTFVIGLLLAGISIWKLPDIADFLGAKGQMHADCVVYGRIILIALPFYTLQFEFQMFFSTAEKPKLGLYMTVLSGVANILLDALFMAVFGWGIKGAAAATAISQVLGGLVPLIYFARPNKSLLRLGKTNFDKKALRRACTNGSSELMSNISMSVVSMLYNAQLLKYAGENGIAAYGVLMYVNFTFVSVFIGYSVGSAPLFGFHFGAKNADELKNLRKKSNVLISIASVVMLVSGYALAVPLSKMFVGYDKALLDMTVHGFRIFALSFLFAGFAIFGSGFFTALSDGLTSAIISFLRTLVFQIAAVLILPLLWGLDGIWISVVAAEAAAVALTFLFVKLKQKKFQY